MFGEVKNLFFVMLSVLFLTFSFGCSGQSPEPHGDGISKEHLRDLTVQELADARDGDQNCQAGKNCPYQSELIRRAKLLTYYALHSRLLVSRDDCQDDSPEESNYCLGVMSAQVFNRLSVEQVESLGVWVLTHKTYASSTISSRRNGVYVYGGHFWDAYMDKTLASKIVYFCINFELEAKRRLAQK